MSTPTATKPVIEIEPDVLPHVRARGVEAVYQHVLESVPRLFPTFRSLHVSIKSDVAIEDYIFIIFDLCVPSADVPDHREATSRWIRDYLTACTPSHREPFVLDLTTEEE
jgi:hypothetical protein